MYTDYKAKKETFQTCPFVVKTFIIIFVSRELFCPVSVNNRVSPRNPFEELVEVNEQHCKYRVTRQTFASWFPQLHREGHNP